jgi:hypothetical protein
MANCIVASTRASTLSVQSTSAHHAAVGQPAAQQVADGHPAAEEQQHRRHRAVGEAGEAVEQRLHVGEHGEHAGVADHRHRQAEQHLRPAQHGEFVAQRRQVAIAPAAGHEGREHDEGQHADRRDGPERCAPAVVQAEPRARRHAEDGRGREAGEHDRDGRGAALRRDQAGRHHGADAEEGAVRERRDDARRHQPAVARRQRTGEVAEREDRHQREQHGLARQPAGGEGQHRRADGDADA